MKPKINIITLGCAKNLVDSEYLSRQLSLNGYEIAFDHTEPGDITIINTCGFINDAKQESIETILEYAGKKKADQQGKVYVMGCLSQRYRDELEQEMPEVDGFYGVYDQERFLNDLNARYFKDNMYQRNLSTPGHYAYLKIAEGCDRKCSFCSIPYIKGSYKSRPLAIIEEEASRLARNGVKELNLIAQDVSYYGYDLDKRHRLPELLSRLSRIDNIAWIRLLYTYPTAFPGKILETMAEFSNICNYLDIPFQHISDNMLKKMHRGINTKQTYNLIRLIYKYIQNITLRTTLLVGHPGETERDFEKLLEFVREVRFDRLGVFMYSEEEGTYSALHYEDDVPLHVKRQRMDEIMKLQQEISYRRNVEKIGKELQVLIDKQDEQHYYGRTVADAPEVDNGVLIEKSQQTNLPIGQFCLVEITGAGEYDLFGKVAG